MNLLFRRKNLKGVAVDVDSTSRNHDSLALRESRGQWRANNRQRFITCRRLEDWLISDWLFKRRHMQLNDLDFEPVRSGLFFCLRLGGTWVAADWWIHYFAMDAQVITLRLDELHSDLNSLLLPLLPENTEPFDSTPHVNSQPSKERCQATFSPADQRRIAAVNPRWTAWQTRVYGQGHNP